MKILFIGDSIIRGKQGVNFVKIIAKFFPHFKITNLGNDGETLNIISKRLLNHLREVNDYDFIVFEGGAGDVVIPSFLEKGKLFEFAYHHQKKKGMIPLTNSADFYSFLKKTIKEVKLLFKGKLILITNGCFNEKLTSELNSKRNEYNKIIKQLVSEEQLLLADAGLLIDEYLKTKNQTDYIYEIFWCVAYTDKIVTSFKTGASRLSKKRNLLVTIDGVHLNDKGAELFSQSVIKVLEKETNQAASNNVR